jgi:hypothetical protein
MDPERERWLENLAVACKKVLADLGADRRHAALVGDVKKLLARIRAEEDEKPE